MLALSVVMTVPAMGFQRQQNRQSQPPQNQNNRPNNPPSRDDSRGNFKSGKVGDWLRKNMNTPPAQQKQELESSDDFKKLTPEGQQRVLNRLNRFNAMSPAQKQRTIDHAERVDNMTPEQQEKARGLHLQLHSLNPDRRIAVRRALFEMKDMSAEDRQKKIDSPQMKKEYNDQERQIMKGYTELGIPDQHSEEPQNPQEEL